MIVVVVLMVHFFILQNTMMNNSHSDILKKGEANTTATSTDQANGFLDKVGSVVHGGVENVRHFIEEKNLSRTVNAVGQELGKGIFQVQQELAGMNLQELWENNNSTDRWETAKGRVFYNFDTVDPTAKFWKQLRQLELTTFLTFLLEIPILIVTICLAGCRCCGRRGIILTSFLLGGIFCFSASIIQMVSKDGEMIGFYVSLLANLGRLSISGTFLLLYLYSSELYPTSIRASVVGILSMAARTSGILAPLLVNHLEPFLPGAALLVFGSMNILSFLVSCRILPETLGLPLTDTISTLRMSHNMSPSRRRGRKRGEIETLQLTSLESAVEVN